MKPRLLCLPLLSGLLLAPAVSQAAPIQLQATSLRESNESCNPYSISGSNFSLASNIFGYCGESPTHYASSGMTLTSYVAIFAPPYPTNVPGQGQTTGRIDLPENPGRIPFFTGSIVYNEPTVTLPANTIGSFRLEATVQLQGTLNACLLPAGGVSGGPCDPNYLNFAVVNVDLTGTDTFTGYCFDPYTCSYSESFAASASPSPEPASLGFICLAGLLSFLGYQSRRLWPKLVPKRIIAAGNLPPSSQSTRRF